MKRLVNLVGMSHRKSYKALMNIPENHPVLLMREPGNPHDPNAIMVLLHVGYVAKEHAAQITPYLDTKQEDIVGGKLVRLYANYAEVEIEDPIPTPDGTPMPDVYFYNPEKDPSDAS